MFPYIEITQSQILSPLGGRCRLAAGRTGRSLGGNIEEGSLCLFSFTAKLKQEGGT